MAAPADTVFDYLKQVGHLPDYFPRMTSAEQGSGEEVHTTADLGGQEVEADAWFTVDADRRRLSWGSEGENDYHGHLEVTGDGAGCEVTATLTTVRAAGDQIQEGLERTLANIKQETEAD